MRRREFIRRFSCASAAWPVDVRVMISAGFYGVYSELGPAFERASGHRLITTRGPSMGDSPEAIPSRLARDSEAPYWRQNLSRTQTAVAALIYRQRCFQNSASQTKS